MLPIHSYISSIKKGAYFQLICLNTISFITASPLLHRGPDHKTVIKSNSPPVHMPCA